MPARAEISLCNLCVLFASVVCFARNSSTTEPRGHSERTEKSAIVTSDAKQIQAAI
jgi:hypothetical protein